LLRPDFFHKDSMSTDAQTAASSPAPTAAAAESVSAVDQAVATNNVAAYRAARLQERSGKSTPIADQPAAAAAAQPDGQAASTDASATPAASEPAKPKKNADTRVQELLRERATERERAARAERELVELRRQLQTPRDDQPAASSPARPAAEKFPDYATYLDQHPDAPLEQWLDARDEWRDTQHATRARAQAEQQHRQTAQQQRTEKVRGQIATKVAADPEFLTKVKPEILDLKPFDALAPGEPAGPLNAIAEEILDSAVTAELLLHFSEHPEDLQRLSTLAPRDLIREFGKLEARLDTSSTAATPTPAKPHPKTITDAPAPPTTLGSRPAEALDPVTAAVVSGDQAAFKAAKHAARLATVRR
jgi:hypothetical protein